ncbi:MAG: M23 family metallopeptidase [Acidobacteria bacterium]|nr:M23 family metallopeptidase [Acidobacteriota bacterium]
MTHSPPRSPAPKDGNRNARKWIAVGNFLGRYRRILLAPLVLILAIFGMISYRSTYQTRRNQAAAAAAAKMQIPFKPFMPEFKEITGSFQRNQTVTEVLLQQGLPLSLIHQIIDCTLPVYDLAKVKAEQLYWLYFTEDGKFRDFRYHVDDERYLTVYHDVANDQLVPVLKNFQFETRVVPVSAAIESSLFASVMDAGEKDQLALDLADIFGSDIDFYTDIQKGDSFRVLVEKKYLDNRFSKYGVILAAAFTNEQKEFVGIRFEDENGKPAYYAPDGKALKKSFLKSPLKYGRITSGFSMARRHPILKIVRPHLGVDYAAPVGTPVQSVGAGKVIRAGRNGGAGKMVTIRHSGGYETSYLHLSRIAVKTGAHVGQGDVIGYVGSTGLSTGPHLDFRIRHHGKAINPSKVIFPPNPPVSPSKFDRFAAVRNKLIDDLRLMIDDSKQALR